VVNQLGCIGTPQRRIDQHHFVTISTQQQNSNEFNKV